MSDSDNNDFPSPEEEPKPSAAELEAAGQDSMFGEPALAQAPAQAPAPAPVPENAPAVESSVEAQVEAPAKSSQPYRVLARKYRPQSFSELIGQEPMVRTLANAIERDRLAHAFLMTGVRGVGKTSTARLIAKALNCIGPDGTGGATIDPCGQCEPCVAIAEGRHIDVIEMDAASHTGVDDVREIIEAVRYAAVSARYKIYIIDEVHMLSRNAFNALLKTLEEPPAHVKFLFATTEVEKLPVTVLSRTQRFDLRRISADLLTEHFAKICAAEVVEAEEEALRIIANAAEGSVRDGLSILDQAIAHADLEGGASGDGAKVDAGRVRDMLGLADKGAQRALLGSLLKGDGKALLAGLDDQYALGVEPLAIMRALMDVVHRITVAQVGGTEADAPSADEREQLTEWAQQIGAPQLHRLWQLLLKGHEEVRQAPDPLVSARMALLRAMHANDLPDPGKLAKQLEQLASQPAPAANAPAASAGGVSAAGTSFVADQTSAAPDWSQLVEQVEQARAFRIADVMRLQVRVVSLEQGHLRFSRDAHYRDDIASDIREALNAIGETKWTVEQVQDEGAASLSEQAEAKAAEASAAMRAHPMVKAALEAFPDAEILDEGSNGGQSGQVASFSAPQRRQSQ